MHFLQVYTITINADATLANNMASPTPKKKSNREPTEEEQTNVLRPRHHKFLTISNLFCQSLNDDAVLADSEGQ